MTSCLLQAVLNSQDVPATQHYKTAIHSFTSNYSFPRLLSTAAHAESYQAQEYNASENNGCRLLTMTETRKTAAQVITLNAAELYYNI